MQQILEKNQTLAYRMYDHRLIADEDGRYYCRAANTVLEPDFAICTDCPLCSGNYPDNDCRYFDLDDPKDHYEQLYPTPEMEMTRIHDFIETGITGEFPEFIEEDGSEGQLTVERAIRFAAMAHKGAYRKGNHVPYIVHPIETMMLVAKMTDDTDVIAAAALHDVIEDTQYTADDLRQIFGERITDLVASESEDKRAGQPKGDTWKIRKEENLEHVKNAPVESQMIMLADKVSNLRATVRDFRQSGSDIWDKFNMKDEAQQAWYYKSVAHVLKNLSYLPAYQEYLYMLEEVFEGVDTPPLIQ